MRGIVLVREALGGRRSLKLKYCRPHANVLHTMFATREEEEEECFSSERAGVEEEVGE